MRISRIIGIDDWSVYARATDGRVVYTIVECISDWCYAPHKGQGEYGSEKWKEDWEFIFATVRDTAHTFVWHPVEEDNPLQISDDDFARTSARSHFRDGITLRTEVKH